jgi:outer membrane protein assembly factor BamE (lipoprotein component of BamABCDE complex)
MLNLVFRATTIAAFILLSLAALPGCLVSSTSQTKTTGANIASGTFDQIKPGATTVGWVHATLGDPTSKSVDGNDEVWKYTYTERTDSTGAVFLVFGGASTSEKTYTTFIEFKDGVVTNKWRG